MAHIDGFGFPSYCTERNEEFLRNLNETDKLAYATATGINMLIPVLISVQRLPTATIHELVLRGYGLIAMITAGLTFGLPVIQESSRTTVEAATYLKDEFSHDHHTDKGFLQTRRKKYMFNAFYILAQVLVVLGPMYFSHHVGKSQNRGFWFCDPHGKFLWHVAFVSPVPVIGVAWYFFLRCTYRKDEKKTGNEQLIVYRKRHWVEPVALLAEQLPMMGQMLMTVYYTFLLSSTYGDSIKTALIRVILVAIAIPLSRMASLWFAKVAGERDSRLLVRCESEAEVDHVLTSLHRRERMESLSARPPYSMEIQTRPTSLRSHHETDTAVKPVITVKSSDTTDTLPPCK